MQNAPSDLAHDLDDLNLITTRIVRALSTRRDELASEARSLDAGLVAALVEWLTVSELKSAWVGKYPMPEREDEGAAAEWSDICNRAWKAERQLLTLARSIREAHQLPLLTPKPASVRPTAEMAVYPESRL